MENPFRDPPSQLDSSEMPNPFEAPRSSAYREEIEVRPGIIVQGNRVVGASPMKLPTRCVLCGARAEDGKRFQRKLTLRPNLFQPELQIEYFYCRGCVWKQRIWGWTATLSWLSLIGSVDAATRYAIFIWFPVPLVVLAVIATLMSLPPIYAARYKRPYFYVGGLAPAFLRAILRDGFP